MLDIKKLKKRDIPEVKRLLGGVFFDKPGESSQDKNLKGIWHSDEFMKSEISNPGILFLVSRDLSGISGILKIIKINPRKALLKNLYVRPDCRRRGIASSLLHEALEKYDLASPGVLIAEVEAENSEGINFYAKEGFKKIGSGNKEAEGTHLEIVIMEKSISAG